MLFFYNALVFEQCRFPVWQNDALITTISGVISNSLWGGLHMFSIKNAIKKMHKMYCKIVDTVNWLGYHCFANF